jgi:hypothetical protein
MNDTLCEWPGCGRQAGLGWDVQGRSYCGPHYFPGLEQAFLKAYATWGGVGEPTDDFKNLFSRYVERLYPAGGMPERMSQDRIESRGMTWKKTQVGLEFTLERRVSANRWCGPFKTVSQQWRFDLETKKLVLLEQTDARLRGLGVIATASRSDIPANNTVNR